ncbi:DUF1345 domain-containing protein [Roseomonas marmotae]|uniref:DUF1345 domain-containing protein n=1 Tax=Roseomonas marmotae TaxID=2768161 RepID=A0ABS3K961_9PROT|nr:DUF1345 domain-containing protein [Roseomonas marmotae]MBO1074008.1 DUF1345 domain-containing protein [Roseomonas marmotae]QTI78796.1 DUF1345 domain-containing protein [Roseomonas marmotae]
MLGIPPQYRPRALVALVAGVLVAVVSRGLGAGGLHAVMFGWCSFVVVHAALLLEHLWAASAEHMRARARALDEGRAAVLGLSLLAAAASLVAVALDLVDSPPGYTALGAATVMLSWIYVHLLFAQDYAREYWLSGGGIEFPGGTKDPVFSEFLYLAFSIGATSGVTDIVTHSPAVRRVVLLHGLIAFAFNAVIVAGAVGIVTGLVNVVPS